MASVAGEFGFLAFIVGTLWVTAVACVIAIPICLLVSIYLAEYAGKKMREWANPLIDILAGIPPVVYGMWGVLVIVPFIKGNPRSIMPCAVYRIQYPRGRDSACGHDISADNPCIYRGFYAAYRMN